MKAATPKQAPALGDEIVMIPVPRRHYDAVIQLLAGLAAGTGHDARQGYWRQPENVRRLQREKLNITARRMLDLTCAKPNTPVSLEMIRRHDSTEYPVARAHLGAFTKLLTLRFDGAPWPVEVDQRDGLLHYSASTEFAKAWNGK